MPPLNNKTSPPHTPLDAHDVLQSLCEQKSYILRHTDFLHEQNTVKALTYWLTEYAQIQYIKTTEDIIASVQSIVSEIDHLINEQLNHIIHHAKFQKLEAAWRGLWLLATEKDDKENIKIKVLDISWAEVGKDINRALEFDQSLLFQKIYSAEFGQAGGEPYGIIIGNYEISHRVSEKHPNDDLSILEGMAQIAAAAFAPFIAGASSEIFGLDDFSALGQPLNLQSIFKQTEYTKWHSLRDKLDTRFTALTLPRILLRLPYRTNPGDHKGIFFYEQSASAGIEHYLWGNACFGFACLLLREFNHVGWFGHIRGVVRNKLSGGLLTMLPADNFESDAKNVAMKPITDVVITDALEREISDLGFIPLCKCYDSPFAAFYNNQSVHKAKLYYEKDVTTNAKLSAMLQHTLCGSRIAHYIKVIFRDKIGKFSTADEIQRQIQKWLAEYTSGRDDLEWEDQARYPLRSASVIVSDHPEKPGHYTSILKLQPHYQLDHMVSHLQLQTELLVPGK